MFSIIEWYGLNDINIRNDLFKYCVEREEEWKENDYDDVDNEEEEDEMGRQADGHKGVPNQDF